MHLGQYIGFGSGRKKPVTTAEGSPVQAQDITVADTLTVGVKPTVSYTFYSADSALEANQPPYADSIEVSGTPVAGETLTSSITNLVIPNGKTAGPHDYQWYRHSHKRNSNGTAIPGATSSSYVVQEADDGYYLQVVVTLRQFGVQNTTGETYYSLFTERVTSDSFNPITDIAWESAYIPADAANFIINGNQWSNRGSLGPMVQDGTNAVPVYDAAEQAMKFTRASAQWLNIPKKNPQWTAPFEIYIRFKPDTLPTLQYIFGFSNTVYLGINSTGGMNFSGNATAMGIVADQWHVARIVWNGATTTVEINHGAPITANAGTGAIGTSTSRFGASFGRSSSFDGWISHLFIKQAVGDTTEQTNMWTYFGL